MRRGVQIELELFWLARLVGSCVALQLNFDNLLLTVAADVVVLLESQSDRIDQSVTRGAASIRQMHLQPLFISERLFADGGQVGIHSGWRRWHVLAEKM